LNQVKKQEQKADEKDQKKKSILALLRQSKLRDEGPIGEENDDEYSFDDLSQEDTLVIEH